MFWARMRWPDFWYGDGFVSGFEFLSNEMFSTKFSEKCLENGFEENV